MYDHVTAATKRIFAWMERLDRWGYITVGLSLLAVSIGLFLNGWVVLAHSWNHDSFLFNSLTLVNNLLLVVILLELFRTIVRFLETDILRIEPYLSVGIIACVRRMLTASAELGDLRQVSEEFFDKYLKDMALNAGLVILLIVGIFMLRTRPGRSDQHDAPASANDKAGAP